MEARVRIELEALSGRERVLSEAEGRAGVRCRNPERSEGSLLGWNAGWKLEARVRIELTYKGFADHAGEVVLIETG